MCSEISTFYFNCLILFFITLFLFSTQCKWSNSQQLHLNSVYEDIHFIIITLLIQGIAVGFVLCEIRSASLYKAMWKKIILFASGLSENLKCIMSDYKKAAITVTKQQFPAASIH